MLITTSAQSCSLVPENSGNRKYRQPASKKTLLRQVKFGHSSSTHFEAINWDVLFLGTSPATLWVSFPSEFSKRLRGCYIRLHLGSATGSSKPRSLPCWFWPRTHKTAMVPSMNPYASKYSCLRKRTIPQCKNDANSVKIKVNDDDTRNLNALAIHIREKWQVNY